MKKIHFTLLVVFLCSVSLVNAQNDQDYLNSTLDDEPRVSLLIYGGVGYAVMDNDNQPNYNLDASTADFLLHYRIGKRYGIATGIGIDQLTGNGFNSLGNFYHERSTLRIPLLLSGNYNLSPKVRLVANIGFYAKTVIRDEYSFVGGNIEDVYEGWNFGLQSGIGLAYNFNQRTSLGIMFNTQGDFNRLDSNSGSGITDEQKTTSINTVGLLFTIGL